MCHFQLVREQSRGLVEWLVGQAKCSKVTGHREARVDILMHLHGIGRIEVHRMHEPSRAIGADGDHGHIKAVEAFANLAKERRVARVSSKVGGAFFALHHPAAPVGAIAVERGAGRAVLCRDGMNDEVFG